MFTSVGSTDFKQHINLSRMAYEIMQNDIISFMEKPSKSGFLNKIFDEYKDYADASISSAVARKRGFLMQILTSIPDSKEKEQIVQKLTKQYEAELQDRVNSYPKGVYVKFRLNKKNFFTLFEAECPEGNYYKSQGKYIKAIIEEYAQNPPLDRERIFFGERLSFIQSCIDGGILLKVKTRKDWIYEVKPYAIRVDESGLYHYLVGIATSPAAPANIPKVSSFRISLLRDVTSRPKSYRSGKVTQAEAIEIEKQLQQKGVQFLLEDAENVVVRLDEQGKKMFSSQFHLRPAPVNIEENGVYHFCCTHSQIVYYFFKFGSHAEIISPSELRKQFVQQYSEAVKLYDDCFKTDIK